MSGQRVKDLGLLPGVCTVCGRDGTLKLREVQDLRRWGPFRLRDREPYGVARCSQCATTFAVRRIDLDAVRSSRRRFRLRWGGLGRPTPRHARSG